MRCHLVLLALAGTLLGSSLAAQDTSPPRDPEAVALLQQAFLVMGGKLPPDVTLTGRIELIEGASRESGSIRILHRGLDQAEFIETLQSRRTLVFIDGRAKRRITVDGTTELDKPLTMEETASSLPIGSPLFILASALLDSGNSLAFGGEDAVLGRHCYRISVWRSFPSHFPRRLSEISKKEIWIGSDSGLPIRIAYERRSSAGPGSFSVSVVEEFSDFRNVAGTLQPFSIKRSVNGSHWATIAITDVQVDKNLSDAEFAIR